MQTAKNELDNVIVNPGQVEANRVGTLYDSVGNDDIWAFRGAEGGKATKRVRIFDSLRSNP